jgi:D-alanyl-D-alanine carboxypeptidase (penicillin-binding protein 5/6)
MAIISAAAMQNPLIRQVAGETAFVGNGAGANPLAGAFTQEYHWETHNDLIKPGSPFYYPGAFGIKTGFHDEAGNCLSASAEKDGRELIAITMFDETAEQRWTDATVLFNYGFNNFSYVDVQAGDIVLGEIPLSNYRLGADSSIEYKAVGKFSTLLSSTQAERIAREVTFLPDLLAPPETDEKTGITDNTTRLKTPVSTGQVIGYADYILDGELLFHAEVISMGDALKRNFNSDMEYHIGIWKARALSPYAVPVYTGVVILLYIIIRITVSARQKKRSSGFYGGRGRRF